VEELTVVLTEKEKRSSRWCGGVRREDERGARVLGEPQMQNKRGGEGACGG
jgi:hypothetical protein